ncbi:MAG: Nif3-like dinuclear metal center hexameric protein [Planctomycetota bacterium]
MATVDEIVQLLAGIAPPRLAEEWDNVGLLVGDRGDSCLKVMTCLTITPDSAAEAIDCGADLIVSHHPLPFRPLKRLTTDVIEGRLLWDLARAGVAVYSPHTAFDSAATGINQQLAEGFGLNKPAPLLPDSEAPAVGGGRIADAAAPLTLTELADRARVFLKLPELRVVGEPDRSVNRIAFACGSGGSLLDTAIDRGCDAFVTGEATFHTCLAAQARGVALLLLGHYASERFAVEALAQAVDEAVADVEVWASKRERDPIRTLR